ncbi:cupin 2 [Xylariales sp. PMI_506]|nr:cupin 2 [Xylariales sp. PMI_506]
MASLPDSHDLHPIRRITASNLPLPLSASLDENAEPGVEVAVDTLEAEPIPGMTLLRTRVATVKSVPASNDGHGAIPLDPVPGIGIVLPGGINMYYIDIPPHTEGNMHRTTSTDYLIVVAGELSLFTPGATPYAVKDGKASYGEPIETICRPGEVVQQRGIMHALTNRTDKWVRVLGIVVDSKPNRVTIADGTDAGAEEFKVLQDTWIP